MIELTGVNRRMILLELAENLKTQCTGVQDVKNKENPGKHCVYEIKLYLDHNHDADADADADYEKIERFLDYATRYLDSLGLKSDLNVTSI